MPKVPKNMLILVAGLLWSGVGVLLLEMASKYLVVFSQNTFISITLAGLIPGFIIYYFGFSNLASTNINRIALYDTKVCIWAFQKWQSYFLILLMVSMGIFLRKSGLVPKAVLAVIYISMGTALFLASFSYYSFLVKAIKQKN